MRERNLSEIQRQRQLAETLLTFLTEDNEQMLAEVYGDMADDMEAGVIDVSSWDELLGMKALIYFLRGPLSNLRAQFEATRDDCEELEELIKQRRNED